MIMKERIKKYAFPVCGFLLSLIISLFWVALRVNHSGISKFLGADNNPSFLIMNLPVMVCVLSWIGCALALASGVTCAVYVTLLSVFRFPEVSGFRMSFYVYVFCFSFMLPVCLALDCLTLPSTAAGWLMCALLALLIGVCATVMFQKGTLLIGGERSAVLSTFEPLTGVVVGILVFDETVTPGMGIGSVLVMAACVLIPVFDAKQQAAQSVQN